MSHIIMKTIFVVMLVLSDYSVKADNYRSRSSLLLSFAIQQSRELKRAVPIDLSDTANIVAHAN